MHRAGTRVRAGGNAVSLKDRLFNIARAEIVDAARRVREGVGGLLDHDDLGSDDFDSFSERHHVNMPPPPKEESPEIRRYYANLELPIGASADEVKAAYRRLMRRYHPDRHATDPARAKVANELAQELRRAYEGLMAHLGEQ